MLSAFSDPKIVFDNFSDPSGGSGSILDSVKMNNTQLTPEQELAKSQQSRKGIQTSPEGKLEKKVESKGGGGWRNIFGHNIFSQLWQI